MDEQLLKDLLATAQANNYNWDIIMPKFPELQSVDLQVLKDYAATAEKYNYDYSVINPKFPELFSVSETTTEQAKGIGGKLMDVKKKVVSESVSEDGSSVSQETETITEDPFAKELTSFLSIQDEDERLQTLTTPILEATKAKEKEVLETLVPAEKERLELLKKKAEGKEETLLELTQYPPDISNLTQEQANEEYRKTMQLKTAEFDNLQKTKGEAVKKQLTKPTINKPQREYDQSFFKYDNDVIEALQKQGNERDLFIYTSSLDRAERLNEELKQLESKSKNPLINRNLQFKDYDFKSRALEGGMPNIVEQTTEYNKLINLRNDIYKNLWNAQGIERDNTIDPELGAQDTVDYFLDIVDDVVSLKGSEASIVSQSNSGLNQYGFNFIGSGGWFNDKMIVSSANGKSIEIELPNSSDDLRNFLENNRRASEIQYLKDAKVTSGSQAVLRKEKRLLKKEDVERELQMFQDRTTVYNKKTQALVKEEAQFSNEVDAWNRRFKVEGETPELVAQREELLQKEKEITARKNKLIEYEDSFKNEGEKLDRMAGAYYFADADNGSFLGATASFLKEGVGSIAADAVYLGLTIPYLVDKGINFLGGGNFHILPTSMLVDNYSEKFKEKAEEMGYNPSSMSEEDTDKVNTALRENALQTELYGEYQEPNPYSKYTNQVLGGRQGGVLNEIREGIRNAYGEMSSREYDKEFTETFWGQVWSGTMSSIPAILTMVASAPAAVVKEGTKQLAKKGIKETLKKGTRAVRGAINPKRQWAMIMQTQDMVNQEMNANPELRNVPEEEKFVLGSIIGLTTGVLEDIGLRNMVNKKGFVNGLILKALGKSGATSSAKSFQQIVREDVKNMIARMGLTAGAGFAAEFETGAVQEMADIGIKELYDAVKGKDYFKDNPKTAAEFINQTLYAGVQEGAGSLILNLPNIMSSRKRGNNFTEIDDATWNLYTNIKNEPEYLSMQKLKLEGEVKKGKLSASEARSIYNTYKNITQAFEEIPKNLKRKEQQEALGLIINRKQLEDKKRDKNPLLTKQEDAAIAEIDKRLAAIGEVSEKRFKTKQDAIQKQSTTEVDADKQTTVGEEVETKVSTTQPQELTGKKLQDQETDVVLEEVTDEVFEEFTNTGNVSEGVINTIVNKVKAGEKLTSQEEAIRQDKSSEVEIKLKESPVVQETITDQPTPFESVSESVSINNPTKKELSKPESILLAKAERAVKAVKRLMPNLKIVVHESDKAYNEGTNFETQLGESGAFDPSTNTIHVNLEVANISTVPHEIFHAIMVNKIKTDKVAQVVSEKMMNSIRKSLPPGNELRIYLDNYVENYKDKGIHNEEQLAELLGRMAIEYKTLTAPQKSKIRKIIENILKAVGIKLPGSFTKSDEEVIRMFNTLSTKLRKGEEILEEDVKLFDDEAYTVSEKLEVKKDAKFKPRDVRKQKNIYSGIDFATEIPTLSLKEFVNRVDGNVYAVTSDATGLGYDSQGDKIDGGFGYSAITENVDGDVGFASLDMNTVKQLYGKIEGKPGDKVGILIMIQKPSATLGNYYGAKFLGRGLQQLQKESPNTYDQVASSLINVIKGNKTIQNAFADTKKNISQEKLINLILNPNNYSEVEFAKEFIKDTTFNVRRILTKSVVPKTATTRTNKSTPVGKVKLQEAGYSLSSFLEEYGDNRLLSKDIMDGDQGGFIVGGFEMVIPDNVDEAISEVEKRGLTHPQFNGKIPSNGNNFIFDGLYPINENFQGFAKPNIGIVKDTRAEVDKIVNRKFKNNLDAYEKKFLEGPKKVNKKDLNYTHLKEKFKIQIKEEIGKTRPELLEDIPAELVSAVAKGTGMVLKERIPYDTEFSKLSPRQKRAQIIGPSAEMSGEIQDGYIVAKSLYDIRDKYKDNKELLGFVDSDPEIKKNAKATDTFDPKRIPFDLKSPTEIFYATGWIRGKDGKYRYEIPSGKLREDRIEKLKGKNLKVFRMNGVPLKDIFDSPELFKLYPELKDITVKSVNYETGTRGGYAPLVPGQTIKKDGLITLNERFFNDGYSVFDEKVPTYKGTKNVIITSDEKLRLTLIHEIQHAIQNIEGFAKGTNPDDAFVKVQEEYGKEFTDMLSTMYIQNRVASDLVTLFEYIPAPVFSGKVKDIVDFKSNSIGEYIVKILNLSKDSDLYNKMEGKVSDFYLKRGGERLKKQYEDKKPTVYSNQITSAISTFYEVINDKPLSKKEILDGSPKAIDFINEKIFLPLNAFIKLDIVKTNDKSSIYKAFSEVESKNAEINEKYFTPYQLYAYTYGEVEARNAAKRELIIKDLGREAEKIVKAEMMGKEVPQEVYDKYEKALDFLRQPFINTEDIPQYEKKWILPSPKIGRPKRKVRKQVNLPFSIDEEFSKMTPRKKRKQLGGNRARLRGEILDNYLTAEILYSAHDEMKYNLGEKIPRGYLSEEEMKNITLDDIVDNQNKFLDAKYRDGEMKDVYLVDDNTFNKMLFYATGWYWDSADNKWRFEFPDGKIKKGIDTTGKKQKLSDVYDAPELYEFYPDIKDLKVTISVREGGAENSWYIPKEDAIEINVKNESRVIQDLVHELQHAIQFREGLSLGGSTTMMGELVVDGREYTIKEVFDELLPKEAEQDYIDSLNKFSVLMAISDIAEQVIYEDTELPKRSTDFFRADFLSKYIEFIGPRYIESLMEINNVTEEQVPSVIEDFMMEFLEDAPARTAAELRDMYQDDGAEGIMEFVYPLSEDARNTLASYSPHSLYERLKGEVEARNVTKRLMGKRKAFFETEDIDKDMQIALTPKEEDILIKETAIDRLRKPKTKRVARKQLAPMDATMQDLIAWGRARNLPDVQIRELLIERNMGTVKEINKALREVVEYMAMPREMADILGGVKQGEKLFKEVMEEFYSQTMEVRDVSESEKARRKRAEEVMKDTPELYKNQTLDPEVAEKTKGMKLVTVQSIIGSPRRFQRVWIKTPAQRREILQKLIDKNPIYQKQPDFTQAQIKSVLDRTLNSTANPSVEQQIKALKDLLKAVRNKERTIEEYRKELKNIINNTLPTVRNVKNFNRLNRLLTAASKVNEKNIIAQSDKVTKIINEIRAQERNERKERIVKLIKAKAKPKAGVDADTQGFFQALKKLIDILEGNDVDNQLDAFKINLEDSEIESIVLKYLNNEKLKSEERSIMFEDYAFELLKDFNEKTVEELDSLFDDLSLLKKEGIDRFKTNRQKRISKYKALQVQVDKQIAQDYKFLINEDGKFLNEEEILARKQEIEDAFEDGELYKGVRLWIKEVVRGQVQSKSSWFKQYLGSMQTLTNSFDNKSKGNTFFTDNVYQKMRDMRDKFLDGEQKQTKIINDIAASIKGIKTGESKRTRVKKALLGRELSPYGQIVEYLAGRNIRFTVVYEGANGRKMTRRESLTRDQALRVYALSKNDVQRDKLMRGKDSKGEGTFYSEENLKYIEDELNRVSNGVLIEFADKVVSYLSNQYFDEINDVYRESNDSNLNRIDNYFPTKTYETSYNQKDIMGQNFHRIFSAETAPALKSRIDTKGRINVKEYAFTSELFNHLEQMEKFKAYALGVKELNAIFNFESVKTLMRTSRLSKLMDLMIKADIAPDQITLNHFGKTWLSKAFRTFTSYALSFKIWQIPKQASSFINAYEDYDSGINTGNIPWLSDTAKEVVDVVGFMYDLSRTVLGLSGDLMPQKMKDGINKQLEKTGLNIKIGDGPLTQAYKISPTFRDRIQQSMANDMWGLESGQKVRRDRQGITYTPKLKRITSKYKKGFRTVGNSPTMLGDALGVMGYMINYRADIRRGMSQEEALKKFNRYEATQQTRGTTEKNYLQLQSNDLTRMFTMFGSTQFLQMNKVVQAAKNIAEATGQGIMPKKKDVRSLLINGAFANLFFSLASRALQYASDDDEDQIEALKDMKKTLLGLNLLKQLPMLGDAVAFMEQKGSGKRFSADPIVNPYLSLVQKMYYNVEDKNWDKMTKEVWGIYAGVDVDPFIGMYNWLIANDSMPIDFYKAIGIAKSYQPKEAKEEIEVEKPRSRIRPTRDQIRKEKIKEQLKLEKESRDLSAWDLFFSLETAILPLYEEEKKAKKEKEKEEEKEKLKKGSRRRRKTRTEIIREQEAEEYKRLKEEAKEKQKRKRRFY